MADGVQAPDRPPPGPGAGQERPAADASADGLPAPSSASAARRSLSRADRRKRRWLGLPLTGLAVMLALLAAVAALWIWTGAEGSLATALRWAGRWTPLAVQGVRGSIRHGGTVDQLTWAQGGLRVQVRGARIAWSPGALLRRQIHVRELAAAYVEIEDRSPAEPSTGPPASLALPLAVRVDAIEVDELRWMGPPGVAVHRAAGRYRYDGRQHRLELHAAIDSASPTGDPAHGFGAGADMGVQATLQAAAPLRLDARVTAVMTTASDRGQILPPLDARLNLQGPLTDLQAMLDARTAGGGAPGQPAHVQAPTYMQAHVQARIAPWAAQPLPEAHARVQRLDLRALLAAFWPDAPRTAITGQMDIAPTGAEGWHVRADLTNAAPTPAGRGLPIDSARADIDWQGQTLTVHALKASGAGSDLDARGHWQLDARQGAVDATLTAPGAALEVKGDVAAASGAGHVQADVRDAARLLAWARTLPGLDAALASVPWFRQGSVQGEIHLGADWRGGWRDAQAAAVQATLTAPGLTLQTSATDAPIRVQDLRASLNGTQAQARLAIEGHVSQGDRRGALHLAASGGREPGNASPVWRISLDGLSAQAQDPQLGAWTLESAAPVAITFGPGSTLGVGAGTLTLAAAGPSQGSEHTRRGQRTTRSGERGDSQSAAGPPLGRERPGGNPAHNTFAHGGQQTPRSGEHERNPPVTSKPPQSRGSLADAPAASAMPAASPLHVTLAWDASRWDGRALATSGRLTGLSFAWIERFAGEPLQDAGITGDVTLAGAWRARIGPGLPLDLHASLERTGGDLMLTASDPPANLQTRIPAGLRVARVTLDGNGQDLRAQAQWTSDHAGQFMADLRTQLTAVPQGIGWAWSDAAPLAGAVSAQLPRLAIWSALAPPGWRLRGTLAADARIDGTRGDPRITGTLTANRLALRSVVDGVQLGGGQLRARFDGTRLVIDAFSLHGAGWRGARGGGNSGANASASADASANANINTASAGPNASAGPAPGGTLTATGEAGWIDGRAQARLTATLDHLRASARPDRQITVSGSVQAALDGRQVTARGHIQVDAASITLPDQSAPTLGDDVVVHDTQNRALRGQVTADAGKKTPGPVARAAASAPSTPASGAPAAPGASPAVQNAPDAPDANGALHADVQVQIDLGEQFRVQGQGIDTRLRGALTLAAQGPLAAMPKLTGVINTVDGRFHAYGQSLDIARGVIRFTGVADNPALDIIALRPIYDADQKAGVQVQGTALLPRVRLYSDPALPDSQTLAWLLLGHAAPATGAESAMLQSAALALLGGRDSRGLASHLGLDELSLNNTTDADGSQNTSVTLGKRLSSRLYAAYQQSLSGATGSLLIFYELSRRWQLRAQAGQNAAVDLIYSLAFD